MAHAELMTYLVGHVINRKNITLIATRDTIGFVLVITGSSSCQPTSGGAKSMTDIVILRLDDFIDNRLRLFNKHIGIVVTLKRVCLGIGKNNGVVIFDQLKSDRYLGIKNAVNTIDDFDHRRQGAFNRTPVVRTIFTCGRDG